jgi:serine protease Do
MLALVVTMPLLAEKPETDIRGESKPAKMFAFPGENASYLGIDSQDITTDRMAALKLKEERGVEVLMVDQDAPAGKAGLKEHDVILEFNGTRVEGVEHLRRLIHEIPAGRTVSMLVSRNGQSLTLKAQLADRVKAMATAKPRVRERIVIPPIELPDMPDINVLASTTMMGYSRAGVVVENLTPQLGAFFGVKNGEGVLVRSVERGTPGDAAGLRAGDVIVRVEKERISDRGDWKSAMRTYAGSKVSLGVVREKREQTLSITLPGRKASDASWEEDFNGFEDMDMGFAPFQSQILKLRKIQGEASAEVSAAMQARRAEFRQALERAQAEWKRQQQELRREVERAKREIKRTFTMD